MLRRMKRLVLLLALAAVVCAEAAQARKPLQIGGVVPELLDPGLQDLTIGLMADANLADVGRITVTWTKGQTAMDPGLLGDLRTGVDKARAAGVDVYLDVYPNGSKQTPNTAADQDDFASWTASVVRGLPGLRHVIVGNEANLNLFWLPQFGSSGQDLAAIGYEHLLARTYDAVKAAAPTVEVLGGALAHSGTDRRGTGRDTHSPAQFILDMGAAYRASGRTKPIMTAFAYHPYMERANLPPTFRHLRSKTLTIADYGKLLSVLKRAFNGTAQRGVTLPLVYDEFGVEAIVPAAQRSSYSEHEPATTHPVDETTQAKYYALGFQLAACQPTVRSIMVFRLIDSEFLSSFQSGVYYADRKTPKSSRAAVAAAAKRYRAPTVAGCGKLLKPQPLLAWKGAGVMITCDVDCAYELTLTRATGGKVSRTRGTAVASLPTSVKTAGRARRGGYRLTLRVTATPYRADPFTATRSVQL
jgi:hypothetical protein